MLKQYQYLILIAVSVVAVKLTAQDYEYIENIGYYGELINDTYQKERCKIDLYYPKTVKKFPTVVWFHGGGLKNGSKDIPEQLKEQAMAVVAVNYRLHPKVKAPVYIEDAAAAVAWTFKNIDRYGGDPDKIIISGSSAGGYLTMMVGLDKSYLA
jgi:acetyl esterase/lipase